MARNVADTCLLLSAMASDDARDPLAYTLHGRAVRGEPALFFPPRRIDLGRAALAFTADFGLAPTERLMRDGVRGPRRRAGAAVRPRPRTRTPTAPAATRPSRCCAPRSFLTAHAEKVRTRPQDCGPNIIANVEEGLRYTLADVRPRGTDPDPDLPRLAGGSSTGTTC